MPGVSANGWPGLPDLLATGELHNPPEPGQQDWLQEDGVLKATSSQHEAWRHFQRTDRELGFQYNKSHLWGIIPFCTSPRLAAPSTIAARKRSKSWAGTTEWHRTLLGTQRIRQEEAGQQMYMLTVCNGVSAEPVLDPPALMRTHLPGTGASDSLSQVAVLSVRLVPAWSTWFQVILWLCEVTQCDREDWMVNYIINPGHKKACTVQIKNPFFAFFYCPLVALFGCDLMPVLQFVKLTQSTKQKQSLRMVQIRRHRAAFRRAGLNGEAADIQTRFAKRCLRRGPGAFLPGSWPNYLPNYENVATCWWVATSYSWSTANYADIDVPDERVWQCAGTLLSAAVLLVLWLCA